MCAPQKNKTVKRSAVTRSLKDLFSTQALWRKSNMLKKEKILLQTPKPIVSKLWWWFSPQSATYTKLFRATRCAADQKQDVGDRDSCEAAYVRLLKIKDGLTITRKKSLYVI
ncbi:unnamed protein product [Lepidochelys olivacea]